MRDLLLIRLDELMLEPGTDKLKGIMRFSDFPACYAQRFSMPDDELLGFFERIVMQYYRQR